MWANKYSVKEIFMGKGDYDADLLEQINTFIKINNIRSGMVNAIGAINNLRVGYYNTDVKKYVELDENLYDKGPFEIINCHGNISIKEGEPFCHLHIVASDREGKCFGGHLLPGVKIFALEFIVYSFEGEELHRGIDDVTKLPLWVK